MRNIANLISLLSDNVSKLQKQVSVIPANNNKTQTNCAKLKQITQERDALQLTVKNLQSKNLKLSSEVSELRAKNAPQAAEISVFKSNNPNSAGAVHIQMPPYFPYPAMFSPTLPLHTNQQQQSFAFSNPILNTACKHTNYGNWVWACHKKALKHSSRKKSRSKRCWTQLMSLVQNLTESTFSFLYCIDF